MMAGSGDLEMKREEDGSGFEWDDESKLYFHASTGFYHDPVAGWYYSSRDGLYYVFESGNYVPLTCDKNEELEAAPCIKSSANELVQEKACLQENSVIDGSEQQCPPSGWLEDTLINLYLSGYSNSEINTESSPRDMETNGEEIHGVCSERLLDNLASDRSLGCQDDIMSQQTEGERTPENVQDVLESSNGVPEEANVSSEEESWLAQYGQVARLNNEIPISFPTVDLWDWEKVTGPVKRRNQEARLVGRLVRRSTKLHPCLPAGGGLLKTAAITEVHLDLVRVASGKVYRLRSPSKKFLASLSAFDSSNPTKDWGFPDIYNSLQSTVLDTKESHCEAEVANTIFNDNVSFNIAEIPAEVGEYQNITYRDRAAERRRLHGGSGIGPGQKDVTNNDFCETGTSGQSFDSKEAAAEAMNLSFGSGSYARRIMESMGGGPREHCKGYSGTTATCREQRLCWFGME
ncbi:uncharacterized protein [Typha latifolia]|uniref:uncharacterized protein isoform X2 n=1 Tax=Typha latifolia TaxID=4733 RepID=UPI003C2C660D